MQEIFPPKKQCEKKLIAASLVMTSATTGDDDTIAYERNVAVMAQVYEKKSSSDYSHMMKLMKMTHEIRRSKINNSTLSAVAIKEEYPFFRHKKWVCKSVHVFITL